MNTAFYCGGAGIQNDPSIMLLNGVSVTARSMPGTAPWMFSAKGAVQR